MAEIKHGTRYAYAAKGCRCGDCKAAQAEYMRQYQATRAAERARIDARHYAKVKRSAPVLTKPLAEVLRAGHLLAEGASYAEVARTVGWDAETVERHFPGRGWTRREAAAFAGSMSRMGAL